MAKYTEKELENFLFTADSVIIDGLMYNIYSAQLTDSLANEPIEVPNVTVYYMEDEMPEFETYTLKDLTNADVRFFKLQEIK